MKDLASDWITQDGVCFVKENGINIYKVNCELGFYWAELLDKTLGYREDGARTSSWNEMYYKLNAAHWQRHAERLAKELADVKAEKQEGQSPPRYKAGDRVECQLFRCDDWYKCTVKKLIEESQTDGRYEYRVVRDNDRITYYASETMMRPLPVPTFRPGDKVRLKGDVNYKAWEITGGIDKGMYPVVAVSGYVAKGWFSAHDIILVEAAK